MSALVSFSFVFHWHTPEPKSTILKNKNSSRQHFYPWAFFTIYISHLTSLKWCHKCKPAVLTMKFDWARGIHKTCNNMYWSSSEVLTGVTVMVAIFTRINIWNKWWLWSPKMDKVKATWIVHKTTETMWGNKVAHELIRKIVCVAQQQHTAGPSANYKLCLCCELKDEINKLSSTLVVESNIIHGVCVDYPHSCAWDYLLSCDVSVWRVI